MKRQTSKSTFYQSFLFCQPLDWLQLHLEHRSLLWQCTKKLINNWHWTKVTQAHSMCWISCSTEYTV